MLKFEELIVAPILIILIFMYNTNDNSIFALMNNKNINLFSNIYFGKVINFNYILISSL